MQQAISPVALTTLLINSMIPPCAVTWEPTEKGIRYLHPRKGWKFVSFRRLRLPDVAIAE